MIAGTVRTRVPVNGGLDESKAANKLALEDALVMSNWRLSKDGTRIEKRLGLAEEVTNFGVDVYGYGTYYNSSSQYCQIAVLETGISRKVATGAWASIHSWSANLTHPVKPLEIQGKQFIIQEAESRMIHTDSADYQIGITAPTTLPTASEAYATVDTLVLNDTMNYADQAAMDAVWTDGDVGSAASTYATSGPATQGPDADAKYMKFTVSSAAEGTMAKRSKALTLGGNKFSIEKKLYFDEVGMVWWGLGYFMDIYTGAFLCQIFFDRSGVFVRSTGYQDKKLSSGLLLDRWQAWKFVVDGTDALNPTVTCYLDGVLQGSSTFSYPSSTTPRIQLYAEGWYSEGGTPPTVYLDSIKISMDGGTAAILEGTHRYAVTYVRGGNYGCESNPIKSVVGTDTFTGTGLNDLATGGTYTGATTKTFRVQIDGTGTPDTIKWSEDAGATWSAEKLGIATTVYLSYGVELTFGATTGHTSGDYWAFTCSVCSGCPTKQNVALTSIPVSSDAQVTARNLYRTTSGGARFYFLAKINDNTTTTFTDNIADLALGDEMEEDHDVMPNGKFSAWWDNRLWVSGDDIVYYSELAFPEEFDISERYITVNRGDQSDEITGLVPFKDSLYVFRKKSIYVIQRTSIAYGIYLVSADVGCRAPWSIVEVANSLMFISNRGIELFNGVECLVKALSDRIDRTIKTIDTTKYDFITATVVQDKYEVWFSIPDRTSGSAVTVVYNYLYDKFYTFSFYKTPSCLVSCENASYAMVNKMGTRDGYLCLCESTYLDNATAITATYRKGWMGGDRYENIRRVDVEYECPSSMTLTANIYVNFDKDVQRTAALTGSTPSATDIELRRPIKAFAELGQRAEWWTVELTNAENVGGDLKVNGMTIYHDPTDVKGKIYGD